MPSRSNPGSSLPVMDHVLMGPCTAVVIPKPNPTAVVFQDPRNTSNWSLSVLVSRGQYTVGVIGFYFPGKLEPCDELCGSSFLSNFFDMGPDALRIDAPLFQSSVSFSSAA